MDAPAAATPAGRAVAVRLLVAGGLFWIAFDHGGYATRQSALAGLVVWWIIGLGATSGRFRIRVGRLGALAVAGLSSLAILDLVSQLWSGDATSAFVEFNRVLVYVGVLLLAAGIAAEFGATAVADGLATGIGGVAVLALASRCFPSLAADRLTAAFQATANNRLSYPIDYWNGLAIFAALGIPLLLWRASRNANVVAAAVAAMVMPVIATDLYLSSSRGGVVVGFVSSVVFLCFTDARWRAGASIVLAFCFGGAAVVAVRHFPAVASRGTGDLGAQGRHAAVAVLLVCAIASLAQLIVVRSEPNRRPSPIVGWVVAVALALAFAATVVAAHPIALVKHFVLPASQTRPTSPSLGAHLLSSNGNGRWQQWTAAVREWESRPLYGRGAGSYYRWWLQHGTLPLQVRNAHSLYLETLGELGVVGVLALVTTLGCGIVGAVRAIRYRAEQGLFAAVAGAYVGFLAGLAFDWIWQLAAIASVGIALLGVLVGRAPTDRVHADVGLAVVALGAVTAMLVGFLPSRWLDESQAAAARGDYGAALHLDDEAGRLQPWSTAPMLQRALLYERLGRLREAAVTINGAVRHDPNDWQLWLVKTRLALRRGRGVEARAALTRASTLNPQSNLFYKLQSPK